MNENKMNKNNDKSEQIDNREQKSQGSIDLDNGVIQLPVSTFNTILKRAISNLIFENKSNEEGNIIDQKELVNKINNSRYVQIQNQLEVFHSYIQSFVNDLKQIKFIQPHGCLTDSVNVNIKIELTNKLNIAIPHTNSNKELETITISSDSEDEPIIKSDTPIKVKAISMKNKNINSVDLEIFNDSKKLNFKNKLDQKSKTKVSIRGVEMNLTNKVLPIKTGFDKTLRNEQYLSNTTRKRKLDSKLEKIFTNSKKKEDSEKSWLKNFKIPKIEKSRTTNLINCQSLAETIQKTEPKSKTTCANNIISAISENKKDSENNWLKNYKIPKKVKSITNVSNGQSSSKTIRITEPKSKTTCANNIISAISENKKDSENNWLKNYKIPKKVKSITNVSNGQSSSKTIEKPEPKSKIKFTNNILSSTSKNKKDSENNWLKNYKIPKKVKSITNVSNGQSSSKTIEKPEPKSKIKFTNNILSSTSKNKKDSENNWLKNYKIPKKVKSITNVSNGQSSSKTIEKPEPKSKIKFTNNILSSTSKNKKDSENNCLNNFKILKNVKSRTNYESSSKTIQKPKPKSKTTFTNDVIPSTSKNKKDSEKNCLNNFKIPINIKSRTNLLNCQPLSKTIQKPDPKSETITNLSNSISVKKLEVATNNVKLSKYPPPLPPKPLLKIQPTSEEVPPIPKMTIKTSGNTVILTWDLNLCLQSSQIKMYELFVCKEIDADPDVSMWKRKGVIKPLMLPMACELEMYHLGYTYHFALRAMDVHNRCTGFALQKTKI